jgi:DNA-binding transcriptional MerR regulator
MSVYHPVVTTGQGKVKSYEDSSMYSMKQACRAVDMTYEALKFYCNEGLVPNVKRDGNNRRVFDDRDIDWIKGLTCLKNCGMSIHEMKGYMELCLRGEASIPERKEILARKRMELLARIAALNDSISYIDTKQQFYDDVAMGKTDYVSNLIPIEK